MIAKDAENHGKANAAAGYAAAAFPFRGEWIRTSAALLFCLSTLLFFSPGLLAEEFGIPMGAAYKGPKCSMAVEGFAVKIPGAPAAVARGLQEMLQTALFESNYFIVLDRSDPQGISAEQLLSDSFMANPDAVLAQGRMEPAETLLYGSLIELEGGGAGIRVKAPWIPLKAGGAYHKAKAAVELRAVDAASGRVLATARAEGSAASGRGMLGASFGGMEMPVELEMFKNTPLALCIRDCIYRSVVRLCKTLPGQYFRHSAGAVQAAPGLHIQEAWKSNPAGREPSQKQGGR